METKKVYTHRYLARVVLEAETPLFIGSGETSLTTDAIVQKDIHGFPMIPGTSLTGVLRHALEDNESNGSDNTKWNSFFGYQAPRGKKGLGSQIKISSAYLILENGKVAEGLSPDFDIENYIKFFQNLPVRQHVKITDKGVANTEKKGLFDNEVVYRGGKFLFEIELKGTEEDKHLWDEFINELKSPLFRIGQGTRNGYGHMEVSDLKSKVFDIREQADFEAYLNHNPSLNVINNVLEDEKNSYKGERKYIEYKLELKPESFFIFSAGYGDEEVDNIPVTEEIIEYENNKLKLTEQKGLIPGSSIKGALRHRTAFHYNKLLGKYADNITDNKYLELLKTNNDAVYELFGAEVSVANIGDEEDEYYKELSGHRGKVIINDIFPENDKHDKIFNHVAIDRFTGGARDGALFSEKVSYFEDTDQTLEIDIVVENTNLSKNVIEAFESALTDVCKGLLPLGGMTTKGHGIFTGKLLKNEQEIYNYETA